MRSLPTSSRPSWPLPPTASPPIPSLDLTNAPVLEWTLTNFKCTCSPADSSCQYSFGIDVHDGRAPYPCSYSMNGTPDGREHGSKLNCGSFAIDAEVYAEATGSGVVYGLRHGHFEYEVTQLRDGVSVKPDQSSRVFIG